YRESAQGSRQYRVPLHHRVHPGTDHHTAVAAAVPVCRHSRPGVGGSMGTSVQIHSRDPQTACLQSSGGRGGAYGADLESGGALVGSLVAPFLHFGRVYFTPELALLAGNAFSYLVSPKARYLLKLEARTQLAPDIHEFRFRGERTPRFRPGQYLEWTLGHSRPDSRGNRRYFTIASSTEEREVRIGVKFYPDASSFKRSLLAMTPGSEIMASEPGGEFVLPADKREKVVLMAGG